MSYLDTESFLRFLCKNKKFLLPVVPDANTMQEHVKDISQKYLEEMIIECQKILSGLQMTIMLVNFQRQNPQEFMKV